MTRKRGFVFGRGGYTRVDDEVGRRIADIGAAAWVVTLEAAEVSSRHQSAKTTESRTASAHHLRRSFAERWAARVSPADLQHLMRHASVTTTMPFYVNVAATDRARSINAQALANAVG